MNEEQKAGGGEWTALREALRAARRFIRGRHSTLTYGPKALLEQIDVALVQATCSNAPPSEVGEPQDSDAKFGGDIFVVTGEHQRTAFFSKAAAERYLAKQDPERFKIVVYAKPGAQEVGEKRQPSRVEEPLPALSGETAREFIVNEITQQLGRIAKTLNGGEHEQLITHAIIPIATRAAISAYEAAREVGDGLREALEKYAIELKLEAKRIDATKYRNERAAALASVSASVRIDVAAHLEMMLRDVALPPTPSSINPDTPEFRAGDGYGMSRVFQQLEQYLETGTCECEQVIEFAVKLEGKFRAPKSAPPAPYQVGDEVWVRGEITDAIEDGDTDWVEAIFNSATGHVFVSMRPSDVRRAAKSDPKPAPLGPLTGYELAGCADRAEVIVRREDGTMWAADWDRFAVEVRRAAERGRE